jgi:GntR family transcriptional regulator/MocR family aminotransferase
MGRRTPSLKTPVEVLDRAATPALYQQLYRAIRDRIVGGDLRLGERLPSTRALARLLGISRNTVLNAYDRLAEENWILAKVGSGTRVEARQVHGGLSSSSQPGRASESDSPERIETRLPTAAFIFRQSHYPLRSAVFRDSDGNRLYLYECRDPFSQPCSR